MSPPDFSDVPFRVADLIERLGRLARSLQHVKGINPAQWEALRYLARANRYSRSPGALADFLGSTRGTVSQTLIALERKGLVGRRPSPRDGRGTAVRLTEAGRTLVAADPLGDLETAVGGLSPAAAEALAQGLGACLGEMRRRKGFRAFGTCPDCRNLRGAGADAPRLCALTGEQMSEADLAQICRVHEPMAA